MFGSRRPPERLDARCAAADANADAASTGERLSRITAIRARGSGGDSKTFLSLMPNAPGATARSEFSQMPVELGLVRRVDALQPVLVGPLLLREAALVRRREVFPQRF